MSESNCIAKILKREKKRARGGRDGERERERESGGGVSDSNYIAKSLREIEEKEGREREGGGGDLSESICTATFTRSRQIAGIIISAKQTKRLRG